MGKAVGRIIRGDDAKLEGRYHLDVGHVGLAKRKNVASATPQAHIVENHPEFAVIEMACCCGTKTHLKCEYANAESSAGEQQTQNPNPSEVPDQEPDQTK